MFGPNQRPAAPWSNGHFWGQFTSVASLPNAAGATDDYLLSDVQVGDVAWVTGASPPGLFVCTDATVGSAVWVRFITTVDFYAPVQRIQPSGERTPFAQIQPAIDAAVSGDVVLVGPGTYAENLTLKAGVALQGMSNGVVNVVGADPGSGDRITFSGPGATFIFDISVEVPTNSDHGLVTTGGTLVGNGLRIRGSTGHTGDGIRVDGGTCLLGDIRFAAGPAGNEIFNGIEFLSGTLNINDVIFDRPLVMDDAIRAIGSGVALFRSIVIEDGSTIQRAVEIGGIDLSIIGLDLGSRTSPSCVIGVEVSSSAFDVDIISANIHAQVTDLLVQPGVTFTTFRLEASLDGPKISAPPDFWAADNTIIVFADRAFDTEAFQVVTGFEVGVAEAGRESALGQGDSYTRGMVVLQATGATAATDGSNFVDISAQAASSGGSPFGFASGASGDVLYLASSLHDLSGPIKHFGHLNQQIAAMVGGAVQPEIWDGASWVPLNVFEGLAQPPFTPRNNDIFRTATRSTERYGILTSNMLSVVTPTPWVAKTVNGMGPYFWSRYRITSAPATPPSFERWKLHPSRTEVESTGFVSRFGESRVRRQLVVHRRITDDLSGATVGNANIEIGAGLVLAATRNLWSANNDDGFGLIFESETTLDPSLPLTLRLGYVTDTAGAGNIVFRSRYRIVDPGQLLNVAQPLTGTLQRTVAAPGVADQLTFEEFTLNINGLTPGLGLVGAAASRLGSNVADTYGGRVEVVSLDIFGWQWAS